MKGFLQKFCQGGGGINLQYDVRIQGDIQAAVGHAFRAENHTHGFRGVDCQMPDATPATWSAADCKRTFNSDWSEDEVQARVSSANKLISVYRGVLVTRSFMYTENNNGLNIGP